MTQRSFARRAGTAGLGLVATGLGLSLASTLIGRRHEAAVPPDGRILDVDGAHLHYVERGSGPAILLVHGLGGQLRNFTYALVERLAAGHREVAVDRPGSGYSKPAPGTTPGIVDQGRLVARFAETLGLDRPLLVGHSLGGAVALAAGLERPELFTGLVLLAPLSQPMETVPEPFRMLYQRSGLARAVMARTVGVPFGKLFSRATAQHIFAPDPVPADFPTEGGGLLALRPGNMEAASFEVSSAKDELEAMATRYPSLDLPVDLLFGRGDTLLDPALHGHHTAQALPHARLHLIEGGHMLPVTHPDETARIIRVAYGADEKALAG